MTIAYSGDSITFPDNSVQATAPKVGMVNRIINGAMVIDQRNAGASVTTSTSYPVDRFNYSFSSGGFSAQRVTDAPPGFANSVKISCTSVSTLDVTLEQRIEGNNIADIAFGTASAATLTLSFWVKSNLTGQFSVFLYRPDSGRSCVLGYVVNAANAWEYKTVSIPADSTGATTATNGEGFRVDFNIALASATGAASVWKALDSQRGITGQVNIGSSTANTFYITGVQLEKGSTATSFDYRPYGTELALCQRYLPAFRYNSAATILPALTQFNSSSTSRGFITFPVPTRATVTGMTISSPNHFVLQSYAGGSSTPNAFTQHQGGMNGAGIDVNFASAVSADKNTGVLQIDNSAGYVYFTGAEL